VNSRTYFRIIQEIILNAPHVVQSDLSFDEISESECYIRGSLSIFGGFELHVAEYVVTEPEFKRLKYRYHLQTSTNELVARWDNATHHPEVETYPHHIHFENGTVGFSPSMDLEQVLNAVVQFLS
jgi:hypothetical protein